MLLSDLQEGDPVFVDANIFIYHFGGRSAECKLLLQRCARRELRGHTSTSVLAETLHRLAELASQGLSAVRAASAEAALEQVTLAAPRAVLLDLRLPGQSGEKLLARLRDPRDGPGRHLPVVIVSVKDLSAEEQQALAAQGVVAIIRKGPAAASAAAAAVGRVLGPSAAAMAVS